MFHIFAVAPQSISITISPHLLDLNSSQPYIYIGQTFTWNCSSTPPEAAYMYRYSKTLNGFCC